MTEGFWKIRGNTAALQVVEGGRGSSPQLELQANAQNIKMRIQLEGPLYKRHLGGKNTLSASNTDACGSMMQL